VRRRAFLRWWPRRTRQRIVAVVLPASLVALTVVLIVLLAPITGDGESPGPAPAALPLPAMFRNVDTDTMTPARVLAVIDGDTIDVTIDGDFERVRYFGVDTPERGQPCYQEARQRNLALVDKEVYLMADVRDRDDNGRLLRYVFTSNGVLVDASLIADGLGIAWRKDGALRDALVDLEATTRELDIGCLWGKN
jgi:endonuclease YncB( thermonuclease family)